MDKFQDMTGALTPDYRPISGDPVIGDLARYMNREAETESRKDREEKRIAELEEEYLLDIGDLADALGYDGQDSDLMAMESAIKAGEIDEARKAFARIMSRAAAQYARYMAAQK